MTPTSGALRNTEVPPETTQGMPAARTAWAYVLALLRRAMRMTMSLGAKPSSSCSRLRRAATAAAFASARVSAVPPHTRTACRREVPEPTLRAPRRVSSPQESRCRKSLPSGFASSPPKMRSA